MPVQINDAGTLKTVGTSSSIFIEYFGKPSNSTSNSVGNGIATLDLPKDIDVEYELPFIPSKALIVCRYVSINGLAPTIGLIQGETVTTPPGVAWSYFANGNFGPSSVQLLGDKLIFGKASRDTYLTAIVIAKE